jgi:hypothetical protein
VIEAVAVDFDGVIHNADNGWQDGVIYGNPIPGSLEALKELMLDHPVFIMTARSDLEPVAQWLAERGFDTFPRDASHPNAKDRWHTRNVLLVTNVKLPAIAYIDDKGFGFESWDEGVVDWVGRTAKIGEAISENQLSKEHSKILDRAASDLLNVSLNCSLEFANGVLWAAGRLQDQAHPSIEGIGEIVSSEEP